MQSRKGYIEDICILWDGLVDVVNRMRFNEIQ